MTGIYYYKLISPYTDDVTKNCKLTVNEIDSNFFNLKSADISAATYVRDEDSKGTLVLIRNNGDKIVVPIDTTIDKNLTYDFIATSGVGSDKGVTLTIKYKDDEGVEKGVTIDNILTSDNINEVIGSDILTKVITDNTLKGLGTMKSPLGLAGVEKTGMLAPAVKVIDLTNGGEIGTHKKGTRIVTKEYVSDYGYLYNGSGVDKIQSILDKEYVDKEINKEVKDKKYWWRVPSKADWDKLLNSIEPCEYRNHNSAACHKELGKLAGKYLKSECGWVNSLYECTCSGKRPYTSCTTTTSVTADDTDDYVFDNTDTIPSDTIINPVGIDKFGMTVYPAGTSLFKNGTPSPFGFKETTAFWTTTHINDDLEQDIYIKVFDYDKSGVYQVAECPEPYYSVRLVKDYDGSNFKETEYIDGVAYKAVLFPESKQIWLASNFAGKNGFITYENRKEGEIPEVLMPNNGDGINDKRIEMFINEFNGEYWEKKVMNEGDTIVIENPCLTPDTATTKTVCWIDDDGEEECIEVEVQTVSQNNLEYRVYLTEDGCDKELRDTDDIIVERILKIIMPIIDKERKERIAADEKLQWEIDELSAYTESEVTDLWEALVDEVSARTEADDEIWEAISALSSGTTEEIEKLWEALSAETEERKEVDSALTDAIIAEEARAISVETALSGAIDDERDRAISAETFLQDEIDELSGKTESIDGQLIDWSKNPFILFAANEEEDNLVLETKDNNPIHFIRVKFNGDFGTI